ncbi:MAG: integrase [Hyphomicrobiales bacterium]|nr:MAG: integrase [Hyphomicrobiales bacterium]
MIAFHPWKGFCRTMVRVVLKGVHKTRKNLADGTIREYFYAWKAGPKLIGKPGSPEFIESFRDAHKHKISSSPDTMGGLVALYKSTNFQRLKPATQRAYLPHIKEIEKRFGKHPLPVKESDYKTYRQKFLAWRDEKADRPRTADMAWSVAKSIMAFGVDRFLMTVNPCARGGRLWTGTRQGSVWTENLFTALLANCSYELGLVCRLALETGQRQADILHLKWSNFDGERFRFSQEKRGHFVSVLLTRSLALEIRRLKDANEARQVPQLFVCLTTRSKPWTTSGLRASFGAAKDRAGIKGLTFHDMRGTAITRAYRDQDIKDLSALSTRFGLSMVSIQALLDKHYLAPDQTKADDIVYKMESKKGTKLQTVSKPSDD